MKTKRKSPTPQRKKKELKKVGKNPKGEENDKYEATKYRAAASQQ